MKRLQSLPKRFNGYVELGDLLEALTAAKIAADIGPALVDTARAMSTS